MTSSESEISSRPTKRPRSSVAGEETRGKKVRGRPRVDAKDATAADRRRTQIRLAQRAYRQRKETTISSLKAQNDRLQSIIEQMNKSFLRVNDSALKSGVLQMNSTLAIELRRVTETFDTLVKSARESSHDDEEDQDLDTGDGGFDQASDIRTAPNRATAFQQFRPSQTSRPPIGQHVEIGWGYSSSFGQSSPPPNVTSPQQTEQPIHSDYSLSIPDSRYKIASRKTQIVRARPRQFTVEGLSDHSGPENFEYHEPLPFGLLDLDAQEQARQFRQPSQTYIVNIPTPSVTPPPMRLPTPTLLSSISTKTLKPIWTYSYDETTFARRLTRAALEVGFHTLSSATTRPAALNHVFRLTLPYMTLDALRERFRMLLARGTDEQLDCLETPFIHLGGAGTHYPRKDSQGNIIPLPNSWNVRSIGPLPMKQAKAENTQDPTQSHTLNIDLSMFEGSDWFDSTDVEGYLQDKKGCRINPKESFAEVLIDDDDDGSEGEPRSSMHHQKSPSITRLGLPTGRPPFSPGLSHGSSIAESTSNNSTPTHTVNPLAQETFVLDMATPSPHEAFKLPEIDAATFFDQPFGLDLAHGFDATLLSDPFGDSPFGGSGPGATLGIAGGETEQMPVVKQRRKKKAWVDVSKLVDELVKHGICLGRAPGFRKEDVDAAFKASLVRAF